MEARIASSTNVTTKDDPRGPATFAIDHLLVFTYSSHMAINSLHRRDDGVALETVAVIDLLQQFLNA